MLSTPRTALAEKLSELYRYGFEHPPAICELGKKVAQNLTGDNITSKDFVGAYLKSLEELCKEKPEYKQQPKYGASVYENLAALMGNVAEELVSREFREEVFAIFKEYLFFLGSQTTQHKLGVTQH